MLGRPLPPLLLLLLPLLLPVVQAPVECCTVFR